MLKRIKNLALLLILLLVVLIVRLIFIINNDKIVTSSVSNYIQQETINNGVYELLDINYKNLINYETNYVLTIDSKYFALNNERENANELITFYYIMKDIDHNFSFYNINESDKKIKYNIKEEDYRKILNIVESLKGVYVYKYYNKGEIDTWSIENILASSMYFSENKEKDSDSLEIFIKESIINNSNNSILLEQNIDGTYNEIKDNATKAQLTLDNNLQNSVRDILNKDEFSEFSNIGAVIIESSTGKILSLAQKDETQPNLVTGGGGIGGYEPGSTFKILTLEAYMQNFNMELNHKEKCTGQICNKVHGELTILEAFEVSCNDIFSKLGNMVGKNELITFAKKQGLFENLLGLDIKSGMETTGRYDKNGNINNISIGQSMQSNLLQMTSIVSAVVNNGVYTKPYILNSFVKEDGEVLDEFRTISDQVISKDIADNVKYAMNKTVLEGTANVTKIEGVEIGAKTGTAEVGNGENLHGWFIGYCNINNKYYSVGVFIPNIRSLEKDNTGGNTAGPIFKEIIYALNDYYNEN